MAAPAKAQGGLLADNIMHFARVLRTTGLPIGPGHVITGIRAVESAGLTSREDFYWTLASVFINRREQFEVFDQAFRIFWRDPKLLERAMALQLPADTQQDMPQPQWDPSDTQRPLGDAEAEHKQLRQQEKDGQGSGRNDDQALGDSIRSLPGRDENNALPGPNIQHDPSYSSTSREMLQHADFEAMTEQELTEAKRLIARLRLPIPEIPTRRYRVDSNGRRVDLRATLRSALRGGGDIIPLRMSKPRLRHPPLAVLCDVSGSMSRYARMFLHFLHAITSDRDRVFSFVFGTSLTNITRHLRHRDVDVALTHAMNMIDDWSGGTRIGHCIGEFNLRWSRRVLAQNATVLLITDGLDGDGAKGLAEQMERLQKSCRQLIWLNPLLRYKGFEARPLGVRAMLSHVDALLPGHNINSLIDLAAVMRQPPQRIRHTIAQLKAA